METSDNCWQCFNYLILESTFTCVLNEDPEVGDFWRLGQLLGRAQLSSYQEEHRDSGGDQLCRCT